MMALQTDTVVNLGRVERDLTGDGRPEVLRLVGVGKSVDSLEVTFSIESSGRTIYQTTLMPLTRTGGFDRGRRVLRSRAEHRKWLGEYGGWFFGNEKFTRPDEFVEELRRSARAHVPLIPEVMDRERRSQFAVDSLIAAGHSRREAERRANIIVRYGAAYDTARAILTWNEIKSGRVTVFEYSPGGDRIKAIAWSARDQRFYHLVECC